MNEPRQLDATDLEDFIARGNLTRTEVWVEAFNDGGYGGPLLYPALSIRLDPLTHRLIVSSEA